MAAEAGAVDRLNLNLEDADHTQMIGNHHHLGEVLLVDPFPDDSHQIVSTGEMITMNGDLEELRSFS
jgi:hypothetical protein